MLFCYFWNFDFSILRMTFVKKLSSTESSNLQFKFKGIFPKLFLESPMDFLILYLRYSDFTWSSRMFSLISSFKISEMSFFMRWTYSSFSVKLLLNTQTSLTLIFETWTHQAAFCKNSPLLAAVKYFRKTIHFRCLKGFWISFCSHIWGLDMELEFYISWS